ncbi:hypothetical protein BBP40_010155 [Aspergillus hancockii]|nr:hypothetical protein BBP40_010155 [Aspergillus hancockii]
MPAQSVALPRVLSVTTSSAHNFSKNTVPSIKLIPGYGVEGDCHAGETVQHRSRLHIKPPPANLRQVHLIPMEVLAQISSAMPSEEMKNQVLAPGALGQNITTDGIDLLGLGVGTELHFVDDASGSDNEAVLVVTGVRNPCPQIDRFQSGLKERFLVRGEDRRIVKRLAGVMTTVKQGGVIKPDMRLIVREPSQYVPLDVLPSIDINIGIDQRLQPEFDRAIIHDAAQVGPLQFDLTKLVSSPLLQSVYSEVLRMRIALMLNRTPTQSDVRLGPWQLDKGRFIVLSTQVAAHDEAVWGPDRTQNGKYPLSQFWAERFLVPNEDSQGGAYYDVEIVDRPAGWLPSADKKFYGVGAMPPGETIPFRIRRKQSC